jgi:hypothetical protein
VYGARRILKNAPMILQSFFSLPKYESSEMDGKMARARRWKWEKFQHNSVSKKIGEERVRGRVPFIPLEAKGRHLDHFQVSHQKLKSKSQEEGRPS